MKTRYLKSFVLSLLSALALVACGGGGGGGSPAPANNNPPADPDAFSLSALQSIAPGTLEFSMTGDDDGIIKNNEPSRRLSISWEKRYPYSVQIFID